MIASSGISLGYAIYDIDITAAHATKLADCDAAVRSFMRSDVIVYMRIYMTAVVVRGRVSVGHIDIRPRLQTSAAGMYIADRWCQESCDCIYAINDASELVRVKWRDILQGVYGNVEVMASQVCSYYAVRRGAAVLRKDYVLVTCDGAKVSMKAVNDDAS